MKPRDLSTPQPASSPHPVARKGALRFRLLPAATFPFPSLVRSRQTRQLEAIEQALRAADRPLAIAEIHAAASAGIPGLGIATIYRAIKTLSSANKIVSLAYPGQPPRYEWAVARDHSHFICHSCRRVFDIEAPEKVPLPKRKPRGFVFSGEEVIYYGTCATCRPARSKSEATS